MNRNSTPAHSPFGGSVAARVLRCPASVRLVAKVPAHLRKSSAYADRGTALHAAMARLIESECSLDDLVGKTIDNYTITRDDVENALRPALRLCGRAPRYARGRVSTSNSASRFPTIAGAFGTADLHRSHRQHHPRGRFQIRQPACASSRFIPMATRTSSTRSCCSTPRPRATRFRNSLPASTTSF